MLADIIRQINDLFRRVANLESIESPLFTATPTANATPIAGGSSTLASGWIPAINLASSGAGGVTGVLPSANGGTGINNGGRTLTISSNSGTLSFSSSSSTLTIPTTGTAALGAGAANRIAYWSGTNSLDSDSIFVWDAANDRLGVGTASPNSEAIAHFHKTYTGSLNLFVTNDSSGTFANAGIRIGLNPNDFVDRYAGIAILGESFPTSGILGPRVTLIESFADAALCIGNLSAQPIIFTINSRNEQGRIAPTGVLLWGKTSGLTGAGDIDANGNIRGAAFRVGANQVIGARATGWSAATGTATRTSFDTTTVTTAQLAERVKALLDDLINHGLIGS